MYFPHLSFHYADRQTKTVNKNPEKTEGNILGIEEGKPGKKDPGCSNVSHVVSIFL